VELINKGGRADIIMQSVFRPAAKGLFMSEFLYQLSFFVSAFAHLLSLNVKTNININAYEYVFPFENNYIRNEYTYGRLRMLYYPGCQRFSGSKSWLGIYLDRQLESNK
jgi:hypothetical protein